MGVLIYDAVSKVEFDDRALAHLQFVIAAKLRRGESFNFSWASSSGDGAARTTLWMHPAIPLVCEFSGGEAPAINRAWIEVLMVAANSVHGLSLLPEPEASATSSFGVA